jgi:hypothetical protein
VVGVVDVNQLVGDYVVDELGGGLDDSPVETEGSVRVARTPALLGFADEDGLRSHSEACGQLGGFIAQPTRLGEGGQGVV